jgi:hypothetical protein
VDHAVPGPEAVTKTPGAVLGTPSGPVAHHPSAKEDDDERPQCSTDATPGRRPHANSEHELRWKLHLLDLAVTGLIDGPHAIERRDLQALQWLVMECQELAPWAGDSRA